MKTKHPKNVPVVDLFAGPGGLGEGFSAFKGEHVKFDVALSVEKDIAAFRTLLLRAFFRQFAEGYAPIEYYDFLRGRIDLEGLKARFPLEFEEASSRCMHLELGPRTTARVYDEIERRIGSKQEPWLLVGGPPCQAYSVVGRSRRTRVNRDDFEKDERHVLYREYLRIVAKFKPPVFVMENVKGLLSAEFEGSSTFERLLLDLQSPSVALREPAGAAKPRTRRGGEYIIYSLVNSERDPLELRPEEYVIASEKFGVPQRRHRVILLGIRADLTGVKPPSLTPSLSPTVADVIGDLPPLRSQLSDCRTADGTSWSSCIRSLLEAARPRLSAEKIWGDLRRNANHLSAWASVGGRMVSKNGHCPSRAQRQALQSWLADHRMDFVCNHETRFHKSEDLLRYLFVSTYGQFFGASPKLHHFPQCLLPNHVNVEKTLKSRHGNFNDRFRVQLADGPATTVTSHIAKDGHSFIHHDPAQCRSWTVREAARIQTFPDNYFFEGYRTDQYRQVGNAVPPYLAFQIARVTASIFDNLD